MLDLLVLCTIVVAMNLSIVFTQEITFGFDEDIVLVTGQGHLVIH
jgi:hypothetical protein